MLPTKNFTGSIIVSTLLKIFAILIGLAGLTLMILFAVSPNTTGVDTNFEMGLKLVFILGTFVVAGTLSSLIAAAACGLDIARDTNARVAISAHVATGTLPMAQPVYAPAPGYAPTAAYAQPPQGATYSPYSAQPQAPQPGQPLQ